MVLVLLALSATLGWAETVEYSIQSGGENRIALEAEKTGFMKGKKHLFEFPDFSGKLALDAGNPENSRVELTIKSASVQLKDTWLSEKDHKKVSDYALKDMLAVEKYPEMRYVSARVTPQGGNRFQVEGTLTIRGIGKPVTLEVTLDAARPLIEGSGKLKMTSYGLKPPSALLGAIGTKDEMTVTFKIVPVR